MNLRTIKEKWDSESVNLTPEEIQWLIDQASRINFPIKLKDKVWMVDDPTDPSKGDYSLRSRYYTYQDIIDENFNWWSAGDCAAEDSEIYKDSCVEDWVIVNWATEVLPIKRFDTNEL